MPESPLRLTHEPILPQTVLESLTSYNYGLLPRQIEENRQPATVLSFEFEKKFN